MLLLPVPLPPSTTFLNLPSDDHHPFFCSHCHFGHALDMDLGGVVSMDGLVGGGVGASSEGGSLLSCSLTNSSKEAYKPKGLLGCEGFHSLGRVAESPYEHCDWRASKMARTEAMVTEAHFLLPDGGQMLSFSSTSKQDSFVLKCDGSLPSYYSPPPPASSSPKPCLWTAGLYSESHDVNMNAALTRARGPFTPSQWLELEHQALIYKYIDARVPIPSSLLVPIRRSLSSSVFPPFSAGSFGSSALGWGSLYLGYAGNTDPEPGRCRRTDGKKWRCSRDAVADQKYCERHMNRGRHRSRKHVEDQSGHAAQVKPSVAPSQSATAVSGGGTSRAAQPQSKLTKSTLDDSWPAPINTMMLRKEKSNDDGQDPVSLSMLSSTKPKSETSIAISEQHKADFQLVSACARFNSSTSFSDNNHFPTLKLEALQPQPYSLHHFIDAWPKSQSDHSTVTWPEIEDMQSERTQLSMSIPMASSKFSSSTSPNNENVTVSPLKLSREYERASEDSQMSILNEVNQRRANWIPIHWEVSMGGPLGEVLTNTTSTPKDRSMNYSSSSLNLMPDGWDSSPQMQSSPSGVLQKTSFGSLTSSTGSSPRADNKKTNESSGGSLCDEFMAQPL
ncbi:growth-regulating factor 7-like [Curcuma longa]|uniref:growth-regulating factor 7-like n=1 Tax=Curcuma longa TaxID=136217 RepID=UPI003D9F8B0B